MAQTLEYMCHDCGRESTWEISDGEIEGDTVKGCPGKGCTRIHEIHLR